MTTDNPCSLALGHFDLRVPGLDKVARRDERIKLIAAALPEVMRKWTGKAATDDDYISIDRRPLNPEEAAELAIAYADAVIARLDAEAATDAMLERVESAP